MTVALVSIAVALLVVAAVVASSRMRLPDSTGTTGRHATGGPAASDPSDGSDLPGGPASEDPPTEVPNRLEAEPPPGPA